MMPFFFLGGGLARYRFGLALLEGNFVQWLGTISYSLYLSHSVALRLGEVLFGYYDPVIILPAVLPFAWLVWRGVEQPSITLSRSLAIAPKTVAS